MNLWGLFIAAFAVSITVSVVIAWAACKVIDVVNNREGRMNKWKNKQ
ncbi:MAG: hypothetical protein ACLRQ0_10175 [Monoglobales bacterium]